jgi:hypothetical protein
MTDHLFIDAQPAVVTRARLPRRSTRSTHPPIDAAGTTRRERLRAHAVLAVLWSALAVTILAYAVSKASVGAAVLGAFVAWAIRLAWSAAWQADGDEQQSRPLTFIP